MPGLRCLLSCRARWGQGCLGLLGLALGACHSQPAHPEVARPPVGHYEGSIALAGQPEERAALDIRHPSPGHYEAEFTAPGAGSLSFVADTVFFSGNQLRLTRPARSGQALTLALDGDFWRGTLTLDSTTLSTILVKRGIPTPSVYHVEEVPQATGSAWLFVPSDTSTPGPALALLPDAQTGPTAALWADALAREGVIVLVLPVPDSAKALADASPLPAAIRLLRSTAGADTSNVGVWAVGAQAAAVAQLLARPNHLPVAYLITQNAEIDLANRVAFRELRSRQVPLLGLYGGGASARRAGALRSVLGRGRGVAVRSYRTTAPDLLVPGGLGPRFGPGLPGEVVEWLRGR